MNILKKYNIRLTKSLGQNFLLDKNVICRIVDAADIAPDDIVIEIGSGIGNMTYYLAQKGKSVIAIEIDKYLIPALTDTLKNFENVQILNADAMDVDFAKLISQCPSARMIVVANLPYYVSTPIIMKLLEHSQRITSMTLMLQKEVAERIVAHPGSKIYGILSVVTQLYCHSKILFGVSSNCFIPRPDVDSVVVQLIPNFSNLASLLDKEMFFKILRAAFRQRRKMLLNSLSSANLLPSKEDVKNVLIASGVDPMTRPETINVSTFIKLSNCFVNKIQ